AITIYDIIRGPVVTEKATELVNKLKKVVLDVHPDANKPLVKEALEKLFDVKVKDVRIIIRKGKVKTFKRMKTVGSLRKRAIVTLKDSASFDKLAASGSGSVNAEQMPSSVSESQ